MTQEIQDSNYWKNRKIDDSYRDWHTKSESWLSEYWQTKNHPHRKQILNILNKLRPWNSLLEIGCNCGVNLYNIRKKFGNVNLTGVDANKDAIEFAKKKLPDIGFYVANIEDKLNIEIAMSFLNNDILLSDATLMYVSDKDIEKVLNRINNTTSKAIILCEWHDESKLGVIKGGHWARNYPELLKDFGWKVRQKKIIWPTSQKWMDYGRIFIATK